jgi:hypothetical protein
LGNGGRDNRRRALAAPNVVPRRRLGAPRLGGCWRFHGVLSSEREPSAGPGQLDDPEAGGEVPVLDE